MSISDMNFDLLSQGVLPLGDWNPYLQTLTLFLEKVHVVGIVEYFRVADLFSDMYICSPNPTQIAPRRVTHDQKYWPFLSVFQIILAQG